MVKALILIDLQNDYFIGNMKLSGIDQAAENAAKLLAIFRQQQLPIYHIQHISVRPGATFFLPDTEGMNINESVAPKPGEEVIQKNYPNSFRNTLLLEKLRANNIKELIIAGAMSHMCIDATTRAAFDYEFKCTVIEDACATRDLKFGDMIVPAAHIHAGFMSALSAVYAQVKRCAEFS